MLPVGLVPEPVRRRLRQLQTSSRRLPQLLLKRRLQRRADLSQIRLRVVPAYRAESSYSTSAKARRRYDCIEGTKNQLLTKLSLPRALIC